MLQKIPQNNLIKFKQQTVEKKSDKDVYSDTPIRLLGFTNEVGAAISPIIGPVGELISYAPALGYIFMDTKDKYQKGDEDSYKKPSEKRAAKQLIFQMLASVILPTAAVKASQAFFNQALDSKALAKHKETFKNRLQNNKTLYNFIHKFADKPHSNKPPTALTKFAHKFEKALNTITVAPLLFKPKQHKSGLRNIGLAVTGLTTLGLVIKPIDKISEHIIAKAVHPALEKI